jgi:hypothetical protein
VSGFGELDTVPFLKIKEIEEVWYLVSGIVFEIIIFFKKNIFDIKK